MAAHSEGCSCWWSRTRRTARCRTSGEYFFDVFMTPSSQSLESPAIPGRFNELLEAELVEVGGEVLEEVALEGVVAVTVDDLVAEGVGVELEVGFDFLLDIDVLGVELVPL